MIFDRAWNCSFYKIAQTYLFLKDLFVLKNIACNTYELPYRCVIHFIYSWPLEDALCIIMTYITKYFEVDEWQFYIFNSFIHYYYYYSTTIVTQMTKCCQFMFNIRKDSKCLLLFSHLIGFLMFYRINIWMYLRLPWKLNRLKKKCIKNTHF